MVEWYRKKGSGRQRYTHAAVGWRGRGWVGLQAWGTRSPCAGRGAWRSPASPLGCHGLLGREAGRAARTTTARRSKPGAVGGPKPQTPSLCPPCVEPGPPPASAETECGTNHPERELPSNSFGQGPPLSGPLWAKRPAMGWSGFEMMGLQFKTLKNYYYLCFGRFGDCPEFDLTPLRNFESCAPGVTESHRRKYFC